MITDGATLFCLLALTSHLQLNGSKEPSKNDNVQASDASFNEPLHAPLPNHLKTSCVRPYLGNNEIVNRDQLKYLILKLQQLTTNRKVSYEGSKNVLKSKMGRLTSSSIVSNQNDRSKSHTNDTFSHAVLRNKDKFDLASSPDLSNFIDENSDRSRSINFNSVDEESSYDKQVKKNKSPQKSQPNKDFQLHSRFLRFFRSQNRESQIKSKTDEQPEVNLAGVFGRNSGRLPNIYVSGGALIQCPEICEERNIIGQCKLDLLCLQNLGPFDQSYHF